MQATTDAATRVALWERFSGKAEMLGAVVERAATEAAADDLVSRLGKGSVCTDGLRDCFPRIAARCVPLSGAEPTPEVVAAGVLAVAETGSVLICEAARDRGACFLAEHLMLLVRADQIVPTLDVALDRLARLVRGDAHHAVLISGPSRTADIERTLTIGVHGPGRLTIAVVEGST